VKSFNGKQCQIILKDIEKLAKLIEHSYGVKLWVTFRDLFREVNERKLKPQYEKRARDWGRMLMKICSLSTMRFYPHMLIYHGKDLVEEFGALKEMNQQGFENANALHNFDGKRHTNHILKSGMKRKISKDTSKSKDCTSPETETEEGEEEDILYMTVQSSALTQIFDRNWAYHLHSPPQTTHTNQKQTIAQVRITKKNSRVYECDM